MFKKLLFGGRKSYTLVDVATKEEVMHFNRPVDRSFIKDEIESGDLPASSYKLVENNGTGNPKILWRIATKKPKTPEEIARLDKIRAIETLQNDAAEVKQKLADHQDLRRVLSEQFGIGSVEAVQHIDMPKGDMSIIEAVRRATAESLYYDIRTKPSKLGESFFGLLDTAQSLAQSGAVLMMAKAEEMKGKSKTTKEIKKDKEKRKRITGEEGITEITFGDEEEKDAETTINHASDEFYLKDEETYVKNEGIDENAHIEESEENDKKEDNCIIEEKEEGEDKNENAQREPRSS